MSNDMDGISGPLLENKSSTNELIAMFTDRITAESVMNARTLATLNGLARDTGRVMANGERRYEQAYEIMGAVEQNVTGEIHSDIKELVIAGNIDKRSFVLGHIAALRTVIRTFDAIQIDKAQKQQLYEIREPLRGALLAVIRESGRASGYYALTRQAARAYGLDGEPTTDWIEYFGEALQDLLTAGTVIEHKTQGGQVSYSLNPEATDPVV